MVRNLRPPPQANPRLGFEGSAMPVGRRKSPSKDLMPKATEQQTPLTARSIRDEDPTKVSPRGKAIQENPPFEDPLFNQMVQEEMKRLEAELQAELDTQSQILAEASISPEGKQLAAHMSGQSTGIYDAQPREEDLHPYAPREGMVDYSAHSPVVGKRPEDGKVEAQQMMNDNEGEYTPASAAPQLPPQAQQPAPAGAAGAAAPPSPVNLKNWKREGYPSEYAYAMAMGELNRKPAAAPVGIPQDATVLAVNDLSEPDKTWEQALSPARKMGQGGLNAMYGKEDEDKYAAQQRYNEQLRQDQKYAQVAPQAGEGVAVHSDGRARIDNFDLSAYAKGEEEQVQQEYPSQGVYGVTQRTERQEKLRRQEEYRRQLDAEGGERRPAPRRRGRSLEPEDNDAPPLAEQRHEYEPAGVQVPASDGFVSSVKIRGEEPSFSENEKGAEAAQKRKKQEEYRKQLELQMQEVQAAKDRYKAEKAAEDRELLEAAAQLAEAKPSAGIRREGGGIADGTMNVNSFEPSSDNMMVIEYQQANKKEKENRRGKGRPDDLQGDGDSGGAPSAAAMASKMLEPVDTDPTAAIAELSSPGKARSRLIRDVYESSNIVGHSSAPEGPNAKDTWRPGGKNHDERKLNAMAEQKEILLKQMEEMRLRKEQEKEKRRQEDMEDERRVRAELAELAAQSGVNPMVAPADDSNSSPKRRYGNPKGNVSFQMASGLGGARNEQDQAGPGAYSGGYNTRGKARLSPDQRSKLQENMINSYQPLEPLPSKAVQRQRQHQEAAREEAAAAAARGGFGGRQAHATPSSVHSGAPRRHYASPPRAGLPSNGSPSRAGHGGHDFVQNVTAQAVQGYPGMRGDSLDAQASFHSQNSRSFHDSNDVWGSMEHMQAQQQGQVQQQQYQVPFQQYPEGVGARPTHGVDAFRPTSAEEVDSFLVNWQRQIHMPQPRSGYAIPLVPPKVSSGENYASLASGAPLRGSMDSMASGYSQQSIHSQPGVRQSHDTTTGDVSFVSESRLIPSNPWDPSGLLAALGPANPIIDAVNQSATDMDKGESNLAKVGRAALGLDGPTSAGDDQAFHLPSERGKVQASHLAGVGDAAAAVEKSLTSDSLLMYLGARTPMGPTNPAANDYGMKEALKEHHENPFNVPPEPMSPEGRSAVEAFERATGNGPASPLSKLVKAHSRPNTGDSKAWVASKAAASAAVSPHKSPSVPKFKAETEATEEDEILVLPGDEGAADKAHSPKTAFQVHHSPVKQQQQTREQEEDVEDVEGQVLEDEEYVGDAFDSQEEDEDGILPGAGGDADDGDTDGAAEGNFKKWEKAPDKQAHSSAALLGAALGGEGEEREGEVVDEVANNAAVTSSAMNYEDDYEDDDFDAQGEVDESDAVVVIKVLSGRGVGPAKFVAEEVDGAGPEPFVVFSVGSNNYASDRAVGTDPEWNQTVEIMWDQFSMVHVQCMDQNEVDTEVLGEKFLDLTVLQLEEGVPMPVEVALENAYQPNATLHLEIEYFSPQLADAEPDDAEPMAA